MELLTPSSLAGRIGASLGTSAWITIDQPRIDEFARCTGDGQWIHCDRDRARRESPFGSTVAHGFLTLSLVAPTFFEMIAWKLAVRQVVNYGLEKVRFLAPVRAGKRVRNHIKLLALEEKGEGRHLLTTEHTIEIEGESRPALVAVQLAYLTE
ncbi:MAG TPA: MaoC family dehydratase [Ramlibacter sp.]|uniref:MaoC family dehydratase n=1 Tax=Ramlibacter sp. TaxID=1917967 RepID=UPI002BC364A6|nr:MaoC family dehydratase [Ramlibacter sp.]HVZ43642.1 MaoC family dehydratase [Ramlibacter sp.]